MSFDAQYPILQVQLQAAKVTLLQALDDRHDDIQRMIRSALDKALPTIEAQIDAQMDAAVKEAIAMALRTAAEAAVANISHEMVERLSGKLEAAIRKRVK